MTDETKGQACTHAGTWERVKDPVVEAEGKLLLMCQGCGVTKTVPKPVDEKGKDGRPILTES